MGTLFGTILSFLVVFGVLVFIHEFGHFFTAKLVGIRVETFSFGYGKRLFGIRRKETDYRVSLFPIGGYVKFLGEGEFFSEGGKVSLPPDHFLAKTRWERFLVMVMGSVMNILLAVLIFTIINMVGVTVPAYQDETPVIGYIEPGSPAEKAGFQLDDEILSVDKEKVRTWNDVEVAVGSKPDRMITVEIRRGGEPLEIQFRTEKRTSYALGYAGFTGRFLTQIRSVNPGSPAEKAGLRQGDIVLSVDGRPIYLLPVRRLPGKASQPGARVRGEPAGPDPLPQGHSEAPGQSRQDRRLYGSPVGGEKIRRSSRRLSRA